MIAEFSPQTAYAIAARMLRSALWRGSIYYAVTEQDREDMLQEAVAEMWRAFALTKVIWPARRARRSSVSPRASGLVATARGPAASSLSSRNL